jgi:hypothetical protein
VLLLLLLLLLLRVQTVLPALAGHAVQVALKHAQLAAQHR